MVCILDNSQPAPGGTLHYSHDPVGNVTGVVGVAGPVRYAFDAAERLSEIETGQTLLLAEYNPYNGLLATLTNATSGIFAEYAYSQMDELTNIVWRAGDGGVLRSFAYGYNAVGMIANVVLETGTNIVYQYDDLDRLTGEIRSGEPGTFYGYDLAGNRAWSAQGGATNVYSLGLGNRLDTWTGGGYAHDAAGCVTNIVRAGKPDLDLVWNGLYQLESVATNGVLAEAYGHDALGRQLYTVRNGVTNWHVYDGIHVVADVDGNGAVLRSYVWGAGIDNLLAFTDHTGGVTNTYYALTDHLGTVHAFADETGAIVESYRFDAWGNVLGVFDGNGSPLSESALGNRYLFQGREYSWATGLYYFRARWFDPETGRWLSNDPIGIAGGLNQYVAFDNNPVNFIDPDGLRAMGIGDHIARIIKGERGFRIHKKPVVKGDLTDEIINAEARFLFQELQSNPPSQMNPARRHYSRSVFDTRFRRGVTLEEVWVYEGRTILGRELNYLGQGMFGAAIGQTRFEMMRTVRRWKQRAYLHEPSIEDYYWAIRGYNLYNEFVRQQTARVRQQTVREQYDNDK